MLLFERPLDIGDWVIADGTTGKVIEINWRSVHIETLLHEMRIIPNVSLYKNSFSNLSRPTHDRTETYDIGFSYDHPPSDVKQALLGLLRATPGIVRQPPPEVHTVEYADSSIIYRLYFTVSRYEDVLPVRDEVLSRVWYVSRRHGLQIPYPIRMQYRYPEPTSPPQPTAAALLERFPRYHVIRDAMLAATHDGTNADGTASAAPSLPARVLTFAPGEEMLSFGATHHGFSLLVEGQAGLSARDAGGRDVRFATLAAGDFYGEATLSAGRPSDFRVVADSDATIVTCDAAVVAGLLERSSGLAAEIGDAIDARRRAALAIRQRSAADPVSHA
jgi:hypothetical protein